MGCCRYCTSRDAKCHANCINYATERLIMDIRNIAIRKEKETAQSIRVIRHNKIEKLNLARRDGQI